MSRKKEASRRDWWEEEEEEDEEDGSFEWLDGETEVRGHKSGENREMENE
jgi:hypothetical protein